MNRLVKESPYAAQINSGEFRMAAQNRGDFYVDTSIKEFPGIASMNMKNFNDDNGRILAYSRKMTK